MTMITWGIGACRRSYPTMPMPVSDRGLSMKLGQDWGGLDVLFAPELLEDCEGGDEAVSRWPAEASLSFPALGDRFTGSPYMGFGIAAGVYDLSLG